MNNWDDETFWKKETDKLANILQPIIFTAMEEAARTGIEMIFSLEKASMDIDWSVFNKEVYDFAKKHTYNLVTGITSSTREFLRKVIPDWVESGLPLDDLAGSLSGIYGDYRAWSIAVTEITRAYAEANIMAWRESGVVEGKKWQTAQDEIADNCPICGPLHDMEIGLEEDGFTTEGEDLGLFSPPAHVNCRCYLLPITVKR